MAKRTGKTTHDYLINAALPEATETYTVIPHGAIIDKVKSALELKGFEIERELYRCNEGAQIAQGIYHLKYNMDDDMGMMFAWSNSYNKSMKFKCSVGGFVHKSLASVIGGNMGNFERKHTGTANDEAFQTIDGQIQNAETYFKQLVADKEVMKSLHVPADIRADFMGRAYFINELVTSEQMSQIRAEFNKPSFDYGGVKDSVWQMYNAIIFSLQRAHPKSWMEQQRMFHYLICKHFNINPLHAVESTQDSVPTELNPSTERKQMDLLELIAEVETEQVSKPVEEVVEELNNLDPPLQDISNFVETAEDLSWQCLSCNQMQDANAIFHDGQLCSQCVTVNS